MSHDIQILHNVPLNTTRSYVRGITKGGCRVFMPMISRLYADKLTMQIQLQIELDAQDLGIFTPTPLEPLLS